MAGQPAVIGRDSDLSELAARLELASDGASQLVLIEGEAGIGKTTLVRAFTSALACPVVIVSGGEVESDLAGGVASQLLTQLESDPKRERFAPGAGQVPDPMATGAALLDAVGVFVERSPLVIVVEDAHWADLPSLQALAFALRRLERDPVLTVMTTRREGVARLPDGLSRLLNSPAGLTVDLRGLTTAETRVLVRQVAGVELSATASERLTEHTGGNPLYVTALAQELDPDDLTVGVMDLPAPREFALVIGDRMAQCSELARALVQAAAVIGESCPLSLALDVGNVPHALGLKAADEATRCGLLELRDGRRGRTIAFPHPLIRAAVYQGLRPSRAATLHDTAATLATDERERLRHRVGAAAGDDEALGRDLEAGGVAAARRGAFESAAKGYLAAARVIGITAERERLVLSAAGLLVRSNDPPSALALRNEIAQFSATPLRFYIQGIFAGTEGRLEEAVDLFTQAWNTCDDSVDPGLALSIASRLATACCAQPNYAAAVEWIRQIESLEPAHDLEDGGAELVMMALIAGGVEVADEFVAACPDLFAPRADGWPRGVPGLVVLQTVGPAADPHGALKAARAVVDHYQLHGPSFDWLGCLDRIANNETNLGLWDDAIATSEALRSGAAAAGLTGLGETGGIYSALIQCRRGDHVGARATIDTLDPTIAILMPAIATVKAELASNEGDHSVAADFLTQLATFAPYVPVLNEPSYIPWRQQYARELLAAGRIDEARTQVEWFTERVVDRPYPLVIAAASHLQALLASADGDTARADQQFNLAVEASERASYPFETAKVQLDHGEFLRRSGRRGDAADRLDSARETFAALSATPWIDRCDHELGLLGRVRHRRKTAAVGRLTPAEQAVARLVADGETNREVAVRLVVSVRTVEYHLSNIYSKLSISSRSQLARALTASQG